MVMGSLDVYGVKRIISLDILRDVFTPEVLEKLRSKNNPSQALLHRLKVLTASGAEPQDSRWREWVRALRKRKAAWEAYLTAAFGIGLFDGEHGKDLRSRLRSPKDENFRSGITECMAIWFLAGKRRLSVEPRPIGRTGRLLEFCIKHTRGDINVEVKAPYRSIDYNNVFQWGDNSNLLQKSIESANKQFRGDVRNLLIITPNFWPRVYSLRGQITRAFFGEPVITFPVDPRSGGPAGPITDTFKSSGHLLETRLPSGKPFKPDNSPRFTRVSTILCIEEGLEFWGRDGAHCTGCA